MKPSSKLILRKTRLHTPQLLGLLLLLIVGVCFFITLFTILFRYEETAEEYFSEQNYADMTFYGTFDDSDTALLMKQSGIISAQGRTVRDYRDGERIYRTISLTDGINVPLIYEGRFPEDESECIILKRNARAMGLNMGDTILLGNNIVRITGFADSPEYVYMVQNERNAIAQPGHFGVVYVTKNFYPEGYNEITVTASESILANDYSLIMNGARAISRKDQINYSLYRSDLDQIRSFSYIFPFVFAVLIFIIIYVMLTRTIQKDRKQIGIIKALGISNRRIAGIYLVQFCFTAAIGSLLGCILSMLVCDGIISIFSSMFVVPSLGFVLYPQLWMGAMIVSVALCAISGFIALSSILPLLPSQAMHPKVPKSGRRILIERVRFIWNRFSFNTRYALKNSLRNKSRFLAMVLGMCGSCALLVFSFGFHNSIEHTQKKYFDDYAKYDVIIEFEPMLFSSEHPAAERIDEISKVLMLPVEIKDGYYSLAVIDPDFDMVQIPDQASNGIIIPEYFAEQWNVQAGDVIRINDYNAVVSAIVPQYLGLTLYTGFDYINTVTNELPPVYNTLYGRSGDITSLSEYLKETGVDFSTIDDNKASFKSIMESISVLIIFMILCSVLLGITVLYSVGLINLSAREYEYMFMGVMGYPHKSILLAHIKETVFQLVISIPFGFILGNILLNSIKGEFSGDSFVISAAIYPQSYLISALSVISVTALMTLVTSRHISRLDIVEGLKAQED